MSKEYLSSSLMWTRSLNPKFYDNTFLKATARNREYTKRKGTNDVSDRKGIIHLFLLFFDREKKCWRQSLKEKEPKEKTEDTMEKKKIKNEQKKTS